jgi:hypothetical protein
MIKGVYLMGAKSAQKRSLQHKSSLPISRITLVLWLSRYIFVSGFKDLERRSGLLMEETFLNQRE